MACVLLLTGTCGSGKTTLARLLARVGWESISEDDLWHGLFGKERGAFGSDDHRRKRRVVHEAVFVAIENALARGQRVVIDATVHESPPEGYEEYRTWFAMRRIPWRLTVLQPALEVAVARDAGRPGWRAGRERVTSLRAKFTGEVFARTDFLDTSDDTPEATMRRILQTSDNSR
jgi:predicted kinase